MLSLGRLRWHVRMDISPMFFYSFFIDKILAADITLALFSSAISATAEVNHKRHKINSKLPHILDIAADLMPL
jgi:hypothetical protein